jgi:hypothetical protein
MKFNQTPCTELALIHHFSKKFRLQTHILAWILLLPASLMLITGCSSTLKNTTETLTRTTKKISRQITFSGDGLKKTVAVVRFENKSLQAGADFQKTFYNNFIKFLKTKCGDIIVKDSASEGNPGSFTQLPKLASGQTDNFALAVIGRQLGLNAIIAATLENIRVRDEIRGILWTRDTHYLIQVVVRAEAYDTHTATKIIDENFVHEVEIDELDYESIQNKKAETLPRINEAFDQILSEMGNRICDVLSEQPWHGYVAAVTGDKIILSAGRQVGLKPGNKLDVFDSGRILEGLDGQRFFEPGIKTAELKIVAVSDDRSEAVKVSGRGLKEGSVVRKK